MPRLHQYRKVDTLPKNAIKVSEYAKERGIHHSLVYHEVNRGKATFEIIQFHGINFILRGPIKIVEK